MTTYNTGNPLGSSAAKDLYDNAQNFDFALNSLTQAIWLDRFGVSRRSWYGLEVMVADAAAAFGITTLSGVSFTTGATVHLNEALLNTANNTYYKWTGSFGTGGKVVPVNSTPESSGGIGPGKWLSVGDTVLRTDLASSDPGKGASLVAMESGETVEEEIGGIHDDISKIDYANYLNASIIKNRLADGQVITFDLRGDSTAWGSTSLNSTVKNPVNPAVVMQRTLELIYGSGKVTVTNNAIPGSALFSMLTTFDAAMQTSTANVVLCNHAQNDCNSLLRTTEQYKADLITFVDIVRKYNKIPILVTPNITLVLDGVTETMTKRLPAFVDAMRSVAKEKGVDLVDNHYYTQKATRYVRGYDIVPDGVHPGTDTYYMIGKNLAIPFIAARVLATPGDLSSLSNVSYRDTITSGRNLRNADSLFTKQLSWDAIADQTGIYYPFILDNPTDDTTIAIGGFQWGGGGKTILTYNDSTSDARFNGTLDQLRDGGTDENAFYSVPVCKLFPGLHVIGIINHSASGGISSSFSGVQLIERRDISTGYPDTGSGYTQSRVITVGDEITFSCYVNSSVGVNENLFVLTETLDKTTAWLTLNNGAGTITLGQKNGTAITVATGLSTGLYNVRLTLNSNRTVSIIFGAVSMTTAAASTPLATCYVSTRGMYSVRKP